jgi:phosphatidylglycerophosphatase A
MQDPQSKSPYPKLTWSAWLATGCGLGFCPVAPGTAGTLPGILLVLLMRWALAAGGLAGGVALAVEVVACVVFILIAIPICQGGENFFKKKDDGRICADEYLTFPLTLLALPLTPVTLVMAFLTHRFFDILKPPPARGLQRLTGGLGIVIDDVFASIYALAANHLLWSVCGLSKWFS